MDNLENQGTGQEQHGQEERQVNIDTTQLDDKGMFGVETPNQEQPEQQTSDENFNREEYFNQYFKEDDSPEFKEYMKTTADKYDLKENEIGVVDKIYKDYEAQVQQNQEVFLQNELAKLSPSEQSQIGDVMNYWESKLGEGSEQFLDGMFSTAQGVRYATQMMEMTGQSLPAFSNHVEKIQPLQQTELTDFRTKINEAAEIGDYKTVDRLKAEMKKAVMERGSSNLIRDLAPFLNK